MRRKEGVSLTEEANERERASSASLPSVHVRVRARVLERRSLSVCVKPKQLRRQWSRRGRRRRGDDPPIMDNSSEFRFYGKELPIGDGWSS